jgi:cell cycle checkpoint control protein RAD9A
MVTLNFTLTPEASARLHDLLSCLAKFSDTVSIEARKDTVQYPNLMDYAYIANDTCSSH